MPPYTTVTTTLPAHLTHVASGDSKASGKEKIKSSYWKFLPGYFRSVPGTFRKDLKWFNIITIAILHTALLWSLIVYPYLLHFRLTVWGFIVGVASGLGVTGGAHRLWTHRSYKANLPMRIVMMLFFSLAGQNTLFDWVRDHRVHHKYTETDADPHNSNRGFFFAHVGWLMMKKHPEVVRRGKEIDMSDVLADPVVQFHQRHFTLLKFLVAFVIPTIVPPLCWGQDWFWSFIVVCIGRYGIMLNVTWLVNSAAHMWGNKPYDRGISPVENLVVSIAALGEGWHNYHHTFPWDYKAAELGRYSVNFTTFWIDLFSKIGWTYDLKSPSEELIKAVVKKRGDGSHPLWCECEQN